MVIGDRGLKRIVYVLVSLVLGACHSTGGPQANSDAASSTGGATSGGSSGTGGHSSSGAGGRPPCLDTSNDPENCGRCFNVCGTKVLAAEQKFPGGIAVNEGNVYWVNVGEAAAGGMLMTVPITGGPPVNVVAEPVVAYAVDGPSVYFIGNRNSITKVPTGGGTPITLASNQPGAFAIAVDQTNVYWATTSGPGCTEDDLSCGTIMRVSKSGGTPTTIASAQPHPTGLAVDGANVYWTTDANNFLQGTISKASVSGGATTTVVSGQSGLRGEIAVAAGNVYFVSQPAVGFPSLMAVPIGGGTPPAVIAPDVAAFRIHEKSLYVVGNVGKLKMVPLDGGTPPVTIDGLGDLQFAVDGTNVYWTTGGEHGSVASLSANSCEAGECRCPDGKMVCLGACVDAETYMIRCGG